MVIYPFCIRSNGQGFDHHQCSQLNNVHECEPGRAYVMRTQSNRKVSNISELIGQGLTNIPLVVSLLSRTSITSGHFSPGFFDAGLATSPASETRLLSKQTVLLFVTNIEGINMIHVIRFSTFSLWQEYQIIITKTLSKFHFTLGDERPGEYGLSEETQQIKIRTRVSHYPGR